MYVEATIHRTWISHTYYLSINTKHKDAIIIDQSFHTNQCCEQLHRDKINKSPEN